MSQIKIAIVGAGLIGRTHLAVALKQPLCRLVGIADPSPAGQKLATDAGVPAFADHIEMLDRAAPEAVIVATPNALHVPVALDCIARGIAVLVEKPVADTVEEAQRMIDAAGSRVPILVGHHRRHNPIIRAAKAAIGDGLLGKPVSATVMCTMLKPDAYFNAAWRREKGGGPVLINLIHEIDLLRHLMGEIDTLQAITSNATRGNAVEDTAAVLLRFASGALGTVSLSDATAAPWAWDLASGENLLFRGLDQSSYHLSGTEASVNLPMLNVFRYPGARGWNEPLMQERLPHERGDPYTLQLRHFIDVARGEAEPLVSAPDAARTLRATLAVREAAATGQAVVLSGRN